MADDTQIEGLPEGATVRALQPEGETAPPQPTGDKSSIEGLPEGSTVRALPPADTTQATAGVKDSTSTPKPQGTASKVWEAANKPLIPEGRAEKEGRELSTSAPTLAESEHPILTGIKKGAAGAYADTLGFARGLSSPLGVAAMGLGALGEAPGAMGKVAGVGSKIAAGGFGAQGAQQAVEGGMDIAKQGATPENLKQTLGGAGMAALGGAGTMHGTEMGEAPAKKTLLAPVRGIGKMAGPLSHVLPTTAGLAAGEAIGHPYYGMLAGKMLVPREPIENFLGKGRTAGLNPEEANIAHLEDRVRDAEKKAKPAKEAYDAHESSRQQGIPAPTDVISKYDTTQKNLAEAQMHLDNAKAATKTAAAPADQEITPGAVAAARPDAPTPTNEELDARQNALMGKMQKQVGIGVPPPENVKGPGQVQPETFPQEPTEAPRVGMGKTELAGGKGTMGQQRLLTEGAPNSPESIAEGTPNRTKPIGEILPPEKPAKPGRLSTLKVGEGGKVIDTEDPLQRKIEEGLQGVPKAEAKAPEAPKAIEGRTATPEAKAEEPKGYPKEEPKGSPEDRTMVEHTINELPNQELQNLGAKYGLSTSTKDYDFSKREPLREGGSKHPVDRNRFHKDLMSKIPQGLADAIARESKDWDEKNPHTFDPASRSSKWRADRAKEILGKAQEEWSAGKPKPSMKTARMSNEELLNNGYTQDQIDKGEHLPTVGGGAPSPEFKNWFGDSKVTDKEGKPLRVYHGTRASTDFGIDFSTEGPPTDDEGNTTTSGSGPDPTAYIGAHFSIEPEIANKFAEGKSGWLRSRFESGEEKPRVIPTYLKLENPKDFGAEDNLRDFIYQGELGGYAGEYLLNQVMKADKVEPETPEADDWLEKYDNEPKFRAKQNKWVFENAQPEGDEDTSFHEAAQDMAMQAKVRLEKLGHDGVKYKNIVEGGTAYVAFHPEQILSSISGKEGVPLEAKAAKIYDKGGVVEPEADKKAEDKDHEKSKKMAKDEPKPKTATPANASGAWSLWES